jgi:metallo-beta-lactamase family protein
MFTYGEASKILTFSGDLGHRRSLTIREPETLPETDVLVLESTYGNRLHTRENVFDLMESVARKTLSRGGILLIPAFAVGRAQEVLYMLGQLQSAGRLPEVPVILDSPMASSATEIYRRYPEDHREFPARLAQGSSQLPKRFEMAQSVDESMLACMGDDPKIIVSASGMLTGGRVLHHLKRLIGGEKNTVLFSGFQAEGTKGRFLQEAKQNGETKIRIHHREYPIEAEVVTIAAMSAHGDYQDHIEWLKAAPCLPKQVVINHGEKDAQTGLKEHLQAEFSFAITVASEQHAYNIA